MRPGINALGHKVRRNNTKRIAKSEPPCCCGNEALQQVATLAGARAGSRGPLRGPTLPAWALASSGPRPSVVCAPAGRWPAFFAHSASPVAPGPLPLRGSAAARRACRRFAAPVRLFAPSLRSPGPGPGRSPRLSRSALVRRFAAPRALAAPAALGVALRPLRASAAALWSPLLCSALPSALRVGPPGPPLPVRCRLRRFGGSAAARLRACAPLACSSGSAALAPAASCPGGLRGPLARLFWPPAPGAFWLRAARLRSACCLCRGCLSLAALACRLLLLPWLRGSPCLPPAPAAPLGLAGSARPPALGALAPALRAPPFLSLLLPWGLTFRRGYDTFVWRGPCRFFGGRPFRGVHGRLENRLVERPGGFFMRSGLSAAAAKSRL